MADRPEEQVRQNLLRMMTGALGYPKGLIVIEKAIDQLPHLKTAKGPIPHRRIDLLCFSRDIHPDYSLYPLLLVECKAIPLNPKVINQVAGYNRYVGAYFIAIANQTEVQTGYFDARVGHYAFSPGLPPYETLIASL